MPNWSVGRNIKSRMGRTRVFARHSQSTNIRFGVWATATDPECTMHSNHWAGGRQGAQIWLSYLLFLSGQWRRTDPHKLVFSSLCQTYSLKLQIRAFKRSLTFSFFDNPRWANGERLREKNTLCDAVAGQDDCCFEWC